ncbi:MAG: TonB-dependent receptor plug domain-containing protein, partial [Cellvibrionaceae bacterium]|nr:TonB-dependent receptor plug domain-containing protein [Cellvibrionaceae bacterium]
ALSTLVLVNGRRVAASGQFGDFVDISNIPAAAIERVEILKDGASALYGSDAVGGVVNFVLKRSLDAPVTRINIGGTTQGGGDQLQLSHAFGLDWDGGNALLGVEYYDRGNVEVTQRDVYKNASDFSSMGGINWRRYTAHYAPVANIFLGNQGGTVNSPVGATVPVGANSNLTMADLNLVSDGIGNTTNVYDGMDLLPDTKRVNLFASFDHDIGDSLSLYGDIRYAERDSDYRLGYNYAIESSLPVGSPFYIDDIDPSLTNADGSIPFAVVVDDRAE